jgi:hypothetical protein
MKALKLTFLFIALAFTASAQPGVMGGFNVDNYQYKLNGVTYDRSATPGFNLGLFYRGWLGRHGVVEPSLLFTRKGAVNNSAVLPVDYYKSRLDYVQFSLPFMFREYLAREVDFTIGGGPFASVLAHADAVTHYQNGEDVRGNYAIGTSSPDDFRPFDAGLRFQSGIRFGQVNLSMAYDLGLADVAPQNNVEIRTRAFSMNLGIMFW